YMHARTYSPALGRFIQPDAARADRNVYAYADDSPISRSDPKGLWTTPYIYLDSEWVDVTGRWLAVFNITYGPLCLFAAVPWLVTACWAAGIPISVKSANDHLWEVKMYDYKVAYAKLTTTAGVRRDNGTNI